MKKEAAEATIATVVEVVTKMAAERGYVIRRDVVFKTGAAPDSVDRAFRVLHRSRRGTIIPYRNRDPVLVTKMNEHWRTSLACLFPNKKRREEYLSGRE